MALTPEQIKQKLSAFRDWELRDNRVVKTYRFSDFRKALDFVNRLALTAEEMDHHPDILIHYNQVTLSLWTHSENGITEKDFKLAKAIEGMAVMSL